MPENCKSIIIKRIFKTLLIAIFLIFIIPIPMNKVYDAVEIKLDDPSYFVQCQVTVRGKYHRNLFSDDMFRGQILVSDYKLTNEKMSKVYFSDDGYPLEYNYIGGYDATGRPDRYTFVLGRLHSKSWFRKMAITVFSDNPKDKDGGGKAYGSWGVWTNYDGYCIVPLATNREEALDILFKTGVIQDMNYR